ncbi:hypothetical protein DEU56DRAFT_915283 [Suillus clintonianus]|uniref:uncharacterized protein n=1 Tax=Suillus clintonianus TaxID=1904413 RepID=UPI001B865988|nr:uncharacterized protein DEU56DRAFT_915283 [Suillus clintonianus]KAG2129164.1 hypothetical protein DEU56DRAFT_915283 [Suillus clintonianus]
MSSESRLKVGYIYTPPSSSNNYISDITEWVVHPQFDFEDVKKSFFKVAYIREDITQTSGVETGVFRPTYVSTDELALSPTGFVVPDGWKKVCMYSDEENVPLPALQKVAKPDDATIPLTFSADFGDDEFMSAISSLSEGIWMDNDTSAFEAPSPAPPTSMGFGLPLAPESTPSSQPPAVAPPTYGGPALLLTSLIPQPMFITTPNIVEGHYILCDPQQFRRGINYTQDYIERHFVAAWVCLQDGRTWGKTFRCTMFGLETSTVYKAQCIREIQTLIAHVDGLWSTTRESQTGQRKDLKLVDNAIKLVTSERTAFVKSLKARACCLHRTFRQGFHRRLRSSKPAPPYDYSLHQWPYWVDVPRSVASSINFTRDAQGKPYRRLTLLIIMAQRLLRTVQNSGERTLLDLFPNDYREIPTQLMSVICAMYVLKFKRRFVINPGTLRSADVRHEAVHQLHLLTMARQRTDNEGVELNYWITTRDGEGGWLADLRNALALANGLRGPTRRHD